MAQDKSDLPPPEVIKATAREIAFEGMLRGIFDAMMQMVEEDERDEYRTQIINRIINLIENVTLEVQPELSSQIKAGAAEKVHNVLD